MGQVQLVRRPRRWDQPLAGDALPRAQTQALLALPVFAEIDQDCFPGDLPLHDIIANDARILKFSRGDIVARKGDYETSAFIVIAGGLSGPLTRQGETAATRWISPRGPQRIKNLNKLIARHATFRAAPLEMAGLLEALRRSARASTLIAEAETTILLEIRLSGLRDLRHWSDKFRQRSDAHYRSQALLTGLHQFSHFDGLDAATLKIIAGHSRISSYGSFDWTHAFQADRSKEIDPVIVQQGEAVKELLVIASGMVAIVEHYGSGEKNVGQLGRGDLFEPSQWRQHTEPSKLQARYGLRAMGHVDVIRVPASVVERVAPALLAPRPTRWWERARGSKPPRQRAPRSSAMLDFALDNRLVNGRQAMVIDMDRCVSCDDCVRACAATYEGVPRFARHGPASGNLMIAHACMHCRDPVCMIDCPTNAIHHDAASGSIVIDDATCIGCGTCAAACPYDNIEMREISNSEGAALIDEDGTHVLRATKCDLCTGQAGGPACQRACPHDALIRTDFKDPASLSDWLRRTPT